VKEQMSRERERLQEENRKLRLEKATLESLRRVETIAVRDLGLVVPPPESLLVVERPVPTTPGAPARARQGRRGGDPALSTRTPTPRWHRRRRPASGWSASG
jgi:hypothetical protein